MKKIKIIALIFLIFILFSFNCQATVISRFAGRNQNTDRKIVVLMYHRITENINETGTYAITPKELEKDILNLKNNGFVFSFANEVDKVIKENPKSNVAVLTFDDGYESDYEYVLPLLEKHKAKATFFVFASMLDKPYYMNKTQLIKLSKSNYACIGNHSFDIHNKTANEIKTLFSNKSNVYKIADDFNKNKNILEKIINKPVTVLSYPNGIYNCYTDDFLKKSNVCDVSLSTEERTYFSYTANGVIGRYNRSDKRTVQDIIDIISKK